MQHKTKGIILVSVLISTAVISPVVYKLVLSQNQNIEKTISYNLSSRAIMDALAVEIWARNTLLDDLNHSTHDSYNENWNMGLPATFSEASRLSANIIDLNSRLNLNNLFYAADDDFARVIVRLFTTIEIDETIAVNLVNALKDWMDDNNDTRATGGAEDDYYMLLDEPYRTANNLMADISELRLIRGMTDEIYKKILPFVTVLPGKTRTNVNTAPLEVLQAILPEEAKDFTYSNSFDFEKLEEFATYYEESTSKKIPPQSLSLLATSSNFFAVNISSEFYEAKIRLTSIISRGNTVGVVNRFLNN